MEKNHNHFLNETSSPLLKNMPLVEPHIFEIPKIKTDVLCNINEKKITKFVTKKLGRKLKIALDNNKNVENDFKENKIIHNRFCPDNIKRRIKALFNNYIINFLNNLIKRIFKNSKIKFVKINIRATKDIGIEYNRILLNKQIKDIISSVSKKYTNKENNRNCIKFIKKQNDNIEIMNILNMTYKDFFTDFYLKSTINDSFENSFEAHKRKILALYGEQYLEKFIENVNGFIDFFINGKKRKSRKVKEVDIISIPIENEITEAATSNGVTNNDNLINDFQNKKMVSTAMQTDIQDINAKLIAFN